MSGLLVPLLPPTHNATANILSLFSQTQTHTWTHPQFPGSLWASSMCHTDLEINQTEKRWRERGRNKEGGRELGQVQGPRLGSLWGPRRTPDIGSLGPLRSPLDHALDKYWDWSSGEAKAAMCVCVFDVCVCKPLEQMVGDVRLRQTIDFRKQISNLVKQKAPLGPGEGGREGVREGWYACLTSATANCREMEGERKWGKNKRMMEERKTAPIELHYCSRKEREEKRGEESGGKEERIMGLMPTDKQQWCWG